MKNARLYIAIITSLLDEALIVFLILWGLPKLGVNIPVYGIVIIAILFAAFAVTTFKLGSRALIRKPVIGLTDMVGMEGKATITINPKGQVIIQGEIWEAKSESGKISPNSAIVVTQQNGLRLTVRLK